jgi:hypothetical protein
MKKIFPIIVIGVLIISGIGAAEFTESKFITKSASFDEYDMVIIAPKSFSKSAQKLINHKNSHNIQSIFKSTQNIYNEYTGRDKAEEIKLFIKDAVEDWGVSYVLLLGGMKGQTLNWHIPVRYVLLDDGTKRYTTFFSDLYYADIYKNGNEFEDWDSNGDNIFAEWGKDQLNLHPDVYLGRLPCRNFIEAKIVVDKIIEYENTAFEKNWFNNLVLIGGDTFPNFPGYEGEETCEFAAKYMENFTKIRLYTSTGNLTGPDEVTNAINNGCGFLFTRGKGGQDRLRTNLPEGDEIIVMQNKYVREYKNKNMYPVCILGECIHAKIDVSILNIFKYLKGEQNYYQQDCIFECIAWRLLNKNNGGAIAVLTNSNICYGTYGDQNSNGIPDDAESWGGRLAVETLRYYGTEDVNNIGKLHANVICDYVNIFPVSSNQFHCKTVLDWILIGDPSLRIGGYQ